MILEDYIAQHAVSSPDKTALICRTQRCTYAQLHEMVKGRVIRLATEGYTPGRVVCLRAYPTIDYLVTYFALHTIGCIVAPLGKDIPEQTFQQIAQELTAQHLSKDIADVLYTTGTTGHAKGVLISHRTILANAENLIEGLGFSHELAFVVNGPLNHIGSLSKIYPLILLGATTIIVDGLKDLNAFFSAFDYPATKMATFLVPASIRMVLTLGADRLAQYADKIDFIETGAAAIPEADMQKLCLLLPNSRLYNTYASTETGIISTYNFNDGKRQAGCLGRPMRHSRILITPEGRIACQGDTLMSGYLGDPERTAMVLRDNTLYTSDCGTLDDKGMLHLTGREDDVINVGGFKVAPTEIEDAALSFPDITDCVCIAVNHLITGQALKLLVVMANGVTLDKRALALHLKGCLENYKVPMLYDTIDAVQRTFNGKIDRKFYR